MRHAHLAPLLLVAALLLGCTRETSAPAAATATATAEATAGAPTGLFIPQATPQSTPFVRLPLHIFDVTTGQLVRRAPDDRTSPTLDRSAVWVVGNDAIERQTFEGKPLEHLDGAWELVAEHAGLRLLRRVDGTYWLWKHGEPPRGLPPGVYRRFSPTGAYIEVQASTASASAAPPDSYPLSLLDTRTMTTTFIQHIRMCQCDAQPPERWSPSGRFMIAENYYVKPSNTHLLDTSTGALVALPVDAWHWSPDRDLLLIQRNAVWATYDPASGQERTLPLLGSAYEVTFLSANRLLVEMDRSARQLSAANLDGSGMRSLNWRSIQAVGPYFLGAGDFRTMCVSILDQDLRELRCVPGFAWSPGPWQTVRERWAPIRESYVVTRGNMCQESGPVRPVIVDVATGTEHPLDEFKTFNISVYWSADERYVLVSQGWCGL